MCTVLGVFKELFLPPYLFTCLAFVKDIVALCTVVLIAFGAEYMRILLFNEAHVCTFWTRPGEWHLRGDDIKADDGLR